MNTFRLLLTVQHVLQWQSPVVGYIILQQLQTEKGDNPNSLENEPRKYTATSEILPQ